MPWSCGRVPVMKVAWALQVTAGVTVSSVATAPSRASAESRGVKDPRCRGVSPTTIIASTGFNVRSPCRIMTAALRASRTATRRNDLPNWQAKWHAVQQNWSARCGRRRSDDRRPYRRYSPALAEQNNKGAGRGRMPMLDTPSQGVEDVRLQSFGVTYEYPVVFTRDAFALGNRS